jgi:phosphohistidine phosphatase
MRRRLILLRHAESGWDDANVRDFDRPLNKRGLKDASGMGALLHEKNIHPDLIISSDAKRALTTAEIVAAELGYQMERIHQSNALYLAPPEFLLAALADAGPESQTVMLVAHNPGITDLANRISTASIDNMPTCGVYMIETEQPVWGSLSDTPGTFIDFYCPKQHLHT